MAAVQASGRDLTNVNSTDLDLSPLHGRDIRLLKLLPGDAGTQICCEVIVVSLDSNPTYTALSYAWGNPPAGRVISLNGRQTKIRKNLWRFLHQARSLPDALFEYIWIDALCVNQVDDGERTHQVALMGEIYAVAERVIAWLGPSYNSSDQAFNNIQIASPSWTAKKAFVKKWGSSAASSIRGICVRRYWERLWIFQELLLARDAVLMCGSSCLPLQSFKSFVLTILACSVSDHAAEQFELRRVRQSPAVTIMQYVEERRTESPISELMLATRDLRCTDMRDRVFAVLSVDKGPSRNILPDYEKPLPHLVNEVLRDHHAFNPPTGFDEVTEKCRELARIMCIDLQDVFAIQEDQLKWSPHMPMPKFGPLDDIGRRKPLVAARRHDVEADKGLYGRGLYGMSITIAWAAYYRHVAVMDFMLNQDLFDISTCFLRAVKMDHYAVVEALLQVANGRWRQELDFSISENANALQLAVHYGRSSIADLLVRAGADVNKRGLDFDRALTSRVDLARAPALVVAITQGSSELVQLLLKHGAKAHSLPSILESEPDLSAWEIALIWGHAQIADILLDAEAENVPVLTPKERLQNNGLSLICTALGEGQENGVRLLSKLCTDYYVIHKKAAWFHVRRMLDDARVTDNIGILRSFLSIDYLRRYEKTCHELAYVLINAVCSQRVDFAQTLFEHYATGYLGTGIIDDLFDHTVSSGSAEMARLLLQYGANVNNKPKYGHQRTALWWAVFRNDDALLRILVEYGADVDCLSIPRSYRPLDTAVDKIQLSSLKLLLESGAEVQPRHISMLIRRARQWCPDDKAQCAIRMLLAHGAKIGGKGRVSVWKTNVLRAARRMPKLVLDPLTDLSGIANVHGV
ncbi:HET-domain-containing protein [Dissoconium aciculare CBS 342.82]|uniref:HET-domain-containing protein n=1 Tax=Dissoconium aciculare CBS 342.82 TaxID=1314786 RepID=A0A6J3LYB3_9PEZI|nr:HET-domain-containing protein [Dissoconium aciculare CBS 342.82]KAF1820638.1 HET-domain-containing protein [Dissoconium aciculare CBS 342.82]